MKLLNLFLVLIFSMGTVLVKAQDEKHVNYYKIPKSVEKEDYAISFDNIVAKVAYNKMAVKIENKTDDYLLIKKEEFAFKINDKDYNPAKKWIFVRPNKAIKRTFKVEGKTNHHVDAFGFDIDGVYKFAAEGKTEDAPNFKLPASQNEIKFGDFKVRLKRIKKKTKETVATFEVEYTGKDVAIIDYTKLAVTVPEKGKDEFANNIRKNKPVLLLKGDKKTFQAVFNIPARYADMQFANMEILWRDTFMTSKAKKLKGATVDFELDAGLTAGKN